MRVEGTDISRKILALRIRLVVKPKPPDRTAIGSVAGVRLPLACGQSAQASRTPMRRSVVLASAVAAAWHETGTIKMEDRLAALEKEDHIDKLLAELKARRGVTA